MNAHTADPFARDKLITSHLDAVRALLRQNDTAENALRCIIGHWQDGERAMVRRQMDADEIDACAEWLAKEAADLATFWHEHAAAVRRG